MPRLLCGDLMPKLWLLIMITTLCSLHGILTVAITTSPTGVNLTRASTSTTHISPSIAQPSPSKTRTYTSTTAEITTKLHGPQPQAVQTSTATTTPAVGPWSTLTTEVTSSTNPPKEDMSTRGEQSSLVVTESGRQLVPGSSEPATELSASTSPTHAPTQSTSRPTEAISQPTDTSIQPESTLETATTIVHRRSTAPSNASESNTTKSTRSTTVAIFANGTTRNETAATPQITTIQETTANTSTPSNASVPTHVPKYTTGTTRSSSPAAHGGSTDPSSQSKDKSSSTLTVEAEIAIIVVISAAAATVLIVAVVCFLRRTKQAKQARGYLTDEDFVTNAVSIGDFTMHSLDLDD